MRVLIAVVVLLTCIYCGGEDELECSIFDREGAYLLEWDELPGGDCAPPPDTLVTLTGGSKSALPLKGCESETGGYPFGKIDGCNLTLKMICTSSDGDRRLGVIESISQVSKNASRLEGHVTIEYRDAYTDRLLCYSTYEVTLKRQ